MINSTTYLFSKNLKRIRGEKGLTQDQLSELTGISQDFLSEIERGKKTPSFKRFAMLSEALETPPHEFFMPLKASK